MLRDWVPLFRLKPHWFIAVACGIALSPEPKLAYAALLVAFAYLVAAYGELANFVYDYQIDRKNPRMKEYAHIAGKIKLSRVKMAEKTFLLASVIAGTALIAIAPAVALLVVLAIHCAYSYSSQPLRLKRFWWGGIVSYTLSTGVLLLISASVLGASMATAVKLAIAFGLGSLSVWTLTNIPDQKYDKSQGVETAPIKFGTAKCVKVYLPFALASSMLSAVIIVNSANNPYAGAPFVIPAAIGLTAYLCMRKELETKITSQTLRIGMLPYRYNMALVTLSYFLI